MPALMVKETTVYTLAELEETFGSSVHEKAIDKVLEYAWEGFEPEFVTEDMANMIKEDYPAFEIDQVKQGYYSGNKLKQSCRPHLYWDMNPYSAECKGSVAVAKFMTEKKLRNKYRLLWSIMRKHGLDPDAPCSFGTGRSEDADLSDLQSDIEYCEGDRMTDLRLSKIEAQIESLEGEIEDYIGEIYSFVLEHLCAEDEYRSSEEYAKEEAEALELKFTEDGDIYHG